MRIIVLRLSLSLIFPHSSPRRNVFQMKVHFNTIIFTLRRTYSKLHLKQYNQTPIRRHCLFTTVLWRYVEHVGVFTIAININTV